MNRDRLGDTDSTDMSRRAPNPPRVPVLVASADAPTQRTVSQVLERAGFLVVRTASGEAALATVEEHLPSLIVLDLELTDMSGYEACYELRERLGEGCPIMFLSGERKEPFDRVAGLLIGADDYVTKPFNTDELLARARRLIARTSVSPSSQDSRLTPREGEVLQLLARGLDAARIADELYISPRTVDTHIERILTKLGVHSRAQAVAHAYREGLIEPS